MSTDALRAWCWALVCASVVMAVDQITKQAAVAAVDPGHPQQIIFGIDLTNVRNTGLWLVVGLVIGGALGNLADRVRIGAAIDFIDPPLWPAFNLADVAIVGGVAWLALMLLEPEHDGS